MAQGYTGSKPIEAEVFLKDTANLDAFSRLRISNPLTVFHNQFTYNLSNLVFETIQTGVGASVFYNTTNRCAQMTFTATPTGGEAFMQTYEYIPYQPSKSQLVFLTFNFIDGVTDVVKFAGLSDGINGFEFQVTSPTNKQFVIYSASSTGNQTAVQSSWNLDKLDGSGPSGLTLDISKVQILVIDFQALYVGRVRMGFDIGGTIVYAHEFLHSNIIAYPYIQTANLPVRCGMTCTGTVSTTMKFICCSVVSEGGQDTANSTGYTFQASNNVTAISATRTYLMSLRPKTTFNGLTNRIKSNGWVVDILVTGNNPVYWELCIGQAITTPTYTDVNTTYSSMEYDTAGTLSGSPAIVIDAGWVGASAQAKGEIEQQVVTRYPITLDRAGLNRDMGTLTLLVTGIGGNSACRGAIKFKELR